MIFGGANQAGEDNRNVARMATLLAGLPDDLPGVTVNSLCASGMSAIAMASQAIRAGDADLVIAGGVESMTRAPWVEAKPEKAFARPGAKFDTSIGWRFTNPKLLERDKATFAMPETAEEVARVDGITREDADAFAFESHQKAIAAIEAGRFAPEIVAVGTKGGDVDTDEGPRPETTLEKLATLRPVVKGGSVVTAGNASSLNDGASAVLVASERAVEELGLAPRARIRGNAAAGLAPEVMGLGPVPATEKLLARTGLNIDDIGAVELNEAFATQSLACIRRLGLDSQIVNNDGGAIALGHPLGLIGLAHRHHAARPHGARTGRTRPRDDVRRGRPGNRDDCWSACDERQAAEAKPVLARRRARRPRDRDPQPAREAQRDRPADHRRAARPVRATRISNPRTLILTGAGGTFAAGADIAQLRDRGAAEALEGINTRAFMRVRELPMPVIAVVDGYALGGGAELAYAADIRIGTTTTKFGNPETGLGIIAAAGATWRLREIVGEAIAAEMLLTGRILNAHQSFAARLVTHLDDDRDEAMARAHKMADSIAKLGAQATQATKRAHLAPRSAHPQIDLARAVGAVRIRRQARAHGRIPRPKDASDERHSSRRPRRRTHGRRHRARVSAGRRARHDRRARRRSRCGRQGPRRASTRQEHRARRAGRGSRSAGLDGCAELL